MNDTISTARILAVEIVSFVLLENVSEIATITASGIGYAGWYVAITTPVSVVLVSVSLRVAGTPSLGKRWRPVPRISGWIRRMYSSIRFPRISD